MKTIWLFGLSGSGKTTIANGISEALGFIHLDADVIRKTDICNGLGFSETDRTTNTKRIADICNIINGCKNVIVSAITPYNAMREIIKAKINNAHLVYINSPLDVCEKRDIKGLYKQARDGKIKDFTGIGNRFDVPNIFDLEIKTSISTPKESINELMRYIENIK